MQEYFNNGDVETLIKFLKPFYCQNKIRLGGKFDGGYVLPLQALQNADCLLSFGISTDFAFEKEFNNKNRACRIFMFDPFIGPFQDTFRLTKRLLKLTKIEKREILLPENLNYKNEPIESLLFQTIKRLFHWSDFYSFTNRPVIAFHKIGLRNYSDNKFMNFETLFSKFELNKMKSIILKIDIEGDEYKIYHDILPYLSNVTTILIEVHNIEKEILKLIDLISNFRRSKFYLTHLHGNNSDVLVQGTEIPNTLELTFNRTEYCAPERIDNTSYPIDGLDSPSNPRWIDYDLVFLKENR